MFKESRIQYLVRSVFVLTLFVAWRYYSGRQQRPSDQQRLLGELRRRVAAAQTYQADPPIANAILAGADSPLYPSPPGPRDFPHTPLDSLLQKLCDTHYPVLRSVSRQTWLELYALAEKLNQGPWSQRAPYPVALGPFVMETNDALDWQELQQLLDQLDRLLLPPLPGVPPPQ